MKLSSAFNILLLFVFCSCQTSTEVKDPSLLAIEYDSDKIADYNRKDWGSWKTTDCRDTRNRVLEAESTIPVTWKTEKKCVVKSGKWMLMYSHDPLMYSTDPKNMDIDHLVPLKAAHDAGAHAWSKEKKKRYFNDLSNPNHLIAVSSRANRSKGSKGPAEWMPDKVKKTNWRAGYRCIYLKHWVQIKEKWELEVDYKSISHLLIENCS